jgi:hypothetical protein
MTESARVTRHLDADREPCPQPDSTNPVAPPDLVNHRITTRIH